MNTKLILAALMMSLSLAACGQKDEAPPADATTEPAPPADVAPPADSTATAPAEGMTPPADTTTPAEGEATEPAPAQ